MSGEQDPYVVVRRAERALSAPEREKLLAEGARVGQIGTYLWEVAGPVYWSEGMFTLLGLDPDEDVHYTKFLEVVHPDDQPRVYAAFEKSMADGRIDPIEYRIVRPDGSAVYIRGTGQAVQFGEGRNGFIGALIDITERRRAELSADLRLQMLESGERAAKVGTFLVDLERREIVWTDGLYRITGLDASEGIDLDRAEATTHPEEMQAQRDWFAKVVQTGQSASIRSRAVRLDGEIRHIECHASSLELEGRKVILGTSTDITERVALEERLRHAAKMEAVATLAAGIAHDFNNYLSVIGINTDLARLMSEDAELGSRLSDIRHATARCAELTSQLLAFARRQPSQPVTLDLGYQLGTVTRLIRGILPETIELDLQLPDVPCLIIADPLHIEQIVMNLVTNARDAMPRGGRLSLVVTREEMARLVVRDTGSGIPEDALPRVFDPYFTSKEAGKGTGLGLASVYGAVRQNSGRVTVESEQGQGTTFTIEFPLAPLGHQPTPELAPPRSLDPEASCKVLLVEDMNAVRKALAVALERAGHVVYQARNGVEALEVLQATAGIDMVVTDLVMPQMGGIELANHVLERSPGMPICFITGYAEEPLPELPTPTMLLRKPLKPADILDAVRTLDANRPHPDMP